LPNSPFLYPSLPPSLPRAPAGLKIADRLSQSSRAALRLARAALRLALVPETWDGSTHKPLFQRDHTLTPIIANLYYALDAGGIRVLNWGLLKLLACWR
jgi:hypothetical protein